MSTRDMRANYHRTGCLATIAGVSDARPPTQVAIRIVRPYANEDEFLTNELETVGKTSIILIGAHPRPAGIILRFEVTLASGATILRGEGRVLAHKERAFRGQPGLSLRFTRLDPKSKALVDRAVAMREARLSGEAPSMRPSAPSSPPNVAPSVVPSVAPNAAPSVAPADAAVRSAPPPPAPAHEPVPVPISFPAPAPDADPNPALEAALTASTPEPPRFAPSDRSIMMSIEESLGGASAAVPAPISSTPVAVEPLSEPAVAARPTPDAPAPPKDRPKDRDGILARLRERAASLSSERVREILSARKS
jgi:hypothetical protein